MSKPIRLSDESWEELVKEMIEEMKSKRTIKGEFNYKITNPDIDRKATILFTPDAFAKMLSLIMVFDKEVGWYCTSERHGEMDDDVYIIDDVLVYPQETTGTTVDSDDEKRTEWFDSLPVETLVKIKCDCHSHVNMETTPSGTDNKDMQEVLDNLPEDGYRIFMIWNKKLEYTAKIFDMGKNVMFNTDDITVDVLGMKIHEFLSHAKDFVKAKTFTYNYGGKTTTAVTKKEEPKKEIVIDKVKETNKKDDDEIADEDWEEALLVEDLMDSMSNAEILEAYESGMFDDDDIENYYRRRRHTAYGGKYGGYYGYRYY